MYIDPGMLWKQICFAILVVNQRINGLDTAMCIVNCVIEALRRKRVNRRRHQRE